MDFKQFEKRVYRKSRSMHTHPHTYTPFIFIFSFLLLLFIFFSFYFTASLLPLILIYKSRHIFLYTPHFCVDRRISRTVSYATSYIHISNIFHGERELFASVLFLMFFTGLSYVSIIFCCCLFNSWLSLTQNHHPFFHSKSFLMRKITQILWKRSWTRSKLNGQGTPPNGKITNQVGMPIYFVWKAMGKGF